ncbi:MAG: hypothetical protein JWP01_3155 [Myxococcales bacterium]|nr:hypothetical protein [Myxococcales bacterium]
MSEHRIEQLITQLVQSAPALDEAVLRDLDGELQANGSPLARSIARVLALLDTGQPIAGIDQGIALPALAMACGTLCDPRLTEREHDAARFEIETLLPLPASAVKPPTLTAPDVPLSSLRRRS